MSNLDSAGGGVFRVDTSRGDATTLPAAFTELHNRGVRTVFDLTFAADGARPTLPEGMNRITWQTIADRFSLPEPQHTNEVSRACHGTSR
ncbi:MAG: hypothetical protein K2Z81_03985 [Cyanobacteria bacterium]|nr:hypothetical protein [Cyanobacteriota bacterium]